MFDASGIIKKIAGSFIGDGISSAFGGGEQGQYGLQAFQPNPLRLSGLDMPIEASSEAGEAGTIETANALDILQWNQRLFGTPYQKTDIHIPGIRV